MEKVNFDVAKEEVERWLDAKKIPEKKREALSGMVDNLIEGVVTGKLRIDEESRIIQTLDFPEVSGINELTYKLRITAKDLDPHKRLVKGDTFDDNLTRVILALTNAPINAIRLLDAGTDRSLAESIAIFFV